MRAFRRLLVTAVLLGAGTGLAAKDLDAESDAAFSAALIAEARHESIPAGMDYYGPLLGSWELQGTSYRAEGKPEKVVGRVEVARVLDGRAIQDVWIFRIDGTKPFDASNRRAGTTLRIYDPAEKKWSATWLDPVTRRRTQLTASVQDGKLVHVGTDASGVPMRWTFTSLSDSGFTWRGEHSEDGGRTWKLNAEYSAHRPADASLPTSKASKTRAAVEGYFDALRQKQAWQAFLSDDLSFTSFTSPVKRVTGKREYLESTKRFYSTIASFEVRELLVNADRAFALTRYELRPPGAPGFASDVAEVFRVRDGKIDSLEIYFDTAPFPK